MKDPEKSLYVKVIETALKYPDGFKYSDIVNNKELGLKDWEKSILNRYFYDACERYNYKDNTKGETIFLFIYGNYNKSNSPENIYTLTFDTEFTFIDFQELKFARKNAQEARKMSTWAIGLSIFAILVSILVPLGVAYFMTQNVVLDNDQFQTIKESMDSFIAPRPK
ncbi:MAG TPA: hypothetical protein VJI66_02040 [Candidatus Paceibacterota bacterium]